MGHETNPPLSPLKQAYVALEKLQAKLEAVEQAKREPIAIIGMGCRFPGDVDSPDRYWELLRDGVDAVTEIPADRWDTSAYYDPDPNTPGKMSAKYGAFVRDVDRFDPQFFSIAPREAVGMDPQQRLLLEVAWEALEHAGQAPDKLSGSRTGVYVAVTGGDYGQMYIKANDLTLLDAYYASGIAHSIASGRISYVLGLHGPSLTVDTACSSSLVTVHLAVQSLRLGECRMALAGGVNLILTPENYVALSKYGMLAPDGHCKTFDAAADGFVRGEGCGIIVMKRLSDALTDGDRILAVIRGSAVNQDGPSSGLTAPNGPSQEAVITEALANSGVEPGQVSYVEAHGTGTSLGDPIEVQALARALRSGDLSKQPLTVASVKTNFGHLEASAGIAGLMKVVLMLQQRQIPAHLHLNQLNPLVNWERLPLVIPTEMTEWEGVDGRWIAGVSSFGFSGTNAHIILEAAPEVEIAAAEVERPLHLVALSGRDENALRELAGRYGQHLAVHSGEVLADVAYTANAGRAHLPQRLAVVADTTEGLWEKLAAFASGTGEAITGAVERSDAPKVTFLFTGQGSQYAGMGRGLYETQPTFRAALDQCAEILAPYLEKPLLNVLFPEEGAPPLLDDTTYTQPALFALEYALAQLWLSWGVQPGMVMGHSVGEYVAACLAGVFSLEDGLKLIAARGRLMGALPAGGAMAAVFADEARVRAAAEVYKKTVSIGAVNGPDSVVISGAGEDVTAILDALKAEGVKSRRLVVSHAFHSPLMDSILNEFEKVAASVTYSAPRLRLMSNLTGKVAGADIATPGYWRQHLREAVQFAASIQAIHGQGYEVFLEIGPGATLLGMGQRCVEDAENPGVWLPSLRPGKDDWSQLLDTLGRLYVAGVPVDWQGFDRDYPRRKLALPTYPFQRARYWANIGQKTRSVPAEKVLHPLLGYRLRTPLKTAQFEAEFQTDTFSFLNDHRIYGAALLPATGYVELAMAAGRALLGGDAALQDFVIHDALVIGDGETRTGQLIAEPDGAGRFTFQYFTQGEGEDDWKLHAAGSLVSVQPVAPEHIALDEVRARCTETVTSDQHYARLRANGLDFGESLHGVAHIWRRDGEALGEIHLPDAAVREMAGYHVHPALLDACVQVLAWAMPATDNVYLPLSIDEFRLYDRPGNAVWSYGQIRAGENGQREVVRGDVRMLDEDGRVVAEVVGLSLKRASADLLRAFAQPRYDDWLYEIAWRPQPLGVSGAPDFIPAPDEIAARVMPQVNGVAEKFDLKQYLHGLLPELEQLTVSYVLAALSELGWKPRVGDRFSTEALAKKLGVVQQHRRLFGRLLEMLAEEGILTRSGTDWQVREVQPVPDAHLHWETLLEEYPHYDAPLNMTRWCGEGMAGALNGSLDPVQLLFPDGGATAERLYRESPASLVYSNLMRAAVEEVIRNLPAGRTLRILEIGGGTGGVTTPVLPILPADRTQYIFTDISPLFVAKAEQNFSAFPFVRYQTLNIEEDPAGQGLAGQEFDLILAANVIHATADLGQTLRHVRQLLVPEGMFMMLEVTERERWVDLTFGLTDGWWRFVDQDVRPDYPLLSQPDWFKVLTANGFSPVAAVPENKTEYAEQAVLIARGPAKSTAEAAAGEAGNWLIFADSGGLGAALAEGLREHGEHAAVVVAGNNTSIGDWQIDPADPQAFQHALGEAANGGRLRGVIHLWGLDAVLPENATGDELEAAQQLATGSALNLVKALAASGGELPRLWMVTRGAVSSRMAAPRPVNLAQSPLWGLGRTITLEHPELKTTRIDLDPTGGADDVRMLLADIVAGGDDDQIAYRSGVRQVARLAYHAPVQDSPLPDEPWQVEIAARGSLDNLRFALAERRAPSAGEVEIRVYATGLNFKDVLNTLGMYPGDPGPLGGECAGIITAIGEGITDLNVGDAVLSLAGGCFASHVIAPAALTVRKPDNLTFEDAAGFVIPFVTAYYCLHHLGGINAGDRVLIHAAAGGVGLAAVQLAQRAGAEIFATAGSPEKRDFLYSLGIQHVMDSRSLDFADEIMQITGGRGVDLVLNSLAGESISRSLSVLADGARFLEIGKSGLLTPEEAAALGRDIRYFIIDWTPDARENPTLIRSMMLDLMSGVAEGSLYPLPLQVFPIEDVSSAFRFMAQAKHIGKIIVTQGRRGVWDGTIHPDASYLVIGGLRGLGLLVAEWLAERGARALALMGRSEPTEAAQATLARLEANGVRIAVIQGDLAREDDVKRALAEIETHLPPLRGVIHSAGLLDDGALLNQEWARFQTVMGPKVFGTWYLHQQTRGLPLDFFVLFSSVASLIGSSGQGNHAAANAFEDALAYHRRALGLPAVSINWGAWSEIGAAVDRNVVERASQQGIGAISSADGLTILSRLMTGEAPQVGVMPVDWVKFLRAFDSVPPYFSELAAEAQAQETARAEIVSSAVETQAQPEILSQLASAKPPKQRALLIGYVQGRAAKVLGLDSTKAVNEKMPLNELGLDSLMAVELRNLLGAGLALKRPLPATLVFDYPTVEAIADYLGRDVLALGEKAEAEPAAPAKVEGTGAALESIEDLSDEEVDRLLQERMKSRK